MDSKSLQRITWGILGAAVVLQFVMPFVYPIVGHDARVHLNWLEQFPKLFREGNLYPRWMPDSFWGFGSPAFYFYPPLTYWCGSLISYVFPSPVAIYEALGLFGTLASIGSCYWYLRSFSGNKTSVLLGAMMYGLFPYRLLDIYTRNAISEHLSFIFLPLVLLAIEKILLTSAVNRKNVMQSIALSSIGWSGLLLSNIPVSAIALYVVPVYAIIRASEKRNYLRLFSPMVGAMIGAAIAAVYLLPISEYTSAITLSSLWDKQYTVSNWGYSIVELLNGSYRFNYTGMVITLICGALVLYRLFALRKRESKKNALITFLIILIPAIALQIPYLLIWFWGALPLFKLIQFAYRWNIIIILAFSGYCSLFFFTQERKYIQWLINILSSAAIIIAVGYFMTMDGIHWQYKGISGHIDAPEYLPVMAETNFKHAEKMLEDHAMDDLISSRNDTSQFYILSVTSESLRFMKEKSQIDMSVIFHKMYFPAWHLRTTEGVEIPIAADSVGRINALLPSAGNEYKLVIEETQSEKTGKIISLAALSLLAISMILTIFWRNPKAS